MSLSADRSEVYRRHQSAATCHGEGFSSSPEQSHATPLGQNRVGRSRGGQETWATFMMDTTKLTVSGNLEVSTLKWRSWFFLAFSSTSWLRSLTA